MRETSLVFASPQIHQAEIKENWAKNKK
ncbi:hypothetical protein PL8927_140105 [Planktothrix serta PCC 8927]|uniref:Uncharacterized protein n=1 Tax=Planktothrix serta PCC 8927 TaxID=671068 RepID=A0A7Z9BFE3_9CYAN|nr:hypothetical protein PL8927_140105 [Planktothrix serta PCC 8927]